MGRLTLVTGCRVVEAGTPEKAGASSDVEPMVSLFESLDRATLAGRSSGELNLWIAPWFERIERRLAALAEAARDDRVLLSELTGAGPLIRTACVQGAERLPRLQAQFEALWARWADITLSHPTYETVRRSRDSHRPWTLQRLQDAAQRIGAETETPADIVLDCLLGNHPLPFGPSDDQELRCARHGYAHSPPSAWVAAFSALELAESDVSYDLGSGLGGPTLMAALGSRAR